MADFGGKTRKPQSQAKAPAQGQEQSQEQAQQPEHEVENSAGLGQAQESSGLSGENETPYLDAAAEETEGRGWGEMMWAGAASAWEDPSAALGFDDYYTVDAMTDTQYDTEFRTKESAERELSRRGQGMDAISSEGSGDHGREEANLTDTLNHQSWYGVAAMAGAMGMPNAARHMRHYLDNSGSPILDVPVDDLVAAAPKAAKRMNDAREQAQEHAFTHIDALGSGADQSFNINGPWRGGSAGKGESMEWYFAVGSFNQWYVADVNYIANGDGTGLMSMTFTWAINDTYNWDGGKVVNIGGVEVSDEQLGRLHVAGLAKEFTVGGTTTPEIVEAEYTGPDSEVESAAEGA